MLDLQVAEWFLKKPNDKRRSVKVKHLVRPLGKRPAHFGQARAPNSDRLWRAQLMILWEMEDFIILILWEMYDFDKIILWEMEFILFLQLKIN